MLALSLQDCYVAERALDHPDQLVRIAAIHHTGRRLGQDERLRGLLRGLLDGDGLLARYAALTMAQAGDAAGVEYFVSRLASAGAQRAQLEGCLRQCRAFPFAALLAELISLDAIAALPERPRRLVEGLLRLNAERFYAARQDPRTDDTLSSWLGILNTEPKLPRREGAFCDRGLILTVPQAEQPGFLWCPERRLFLQFREEQALNLDVTERGRHTLFVARAGDPSAGLRLLYALEDRPPAPVALTAEMLGGETEGLLVGVVASRRTDETRTRVQVLCADGRTVEGTHPAARVELGQLVLVDPGDGREPVQCYLIRDPAMPREAAEAVVRRHAARRGLRVGRVLRVGPAAKTTGASECEVLLEDGRRLTVDVPVGRASGVVLLEPCRSCLGKRERVCDACGGAKTVRCSGEQRCPHCDGTGRSRGGVCSPCGQTGRVQGCEGKGRFTCSACGGTGEVACDACRDQCPGQPCLRCGGTGTTLLAHPCPNCGGKGNFFTGHTICQFCHGRGKVRCLRCKGEREVDCPACAGSGELPCGKCIARGTITCTACQTRQLFFHAAVECLGSP